MSAWLEWVVEHHDRPWLERVAITRAAERKLAASTPRSLRDTYFPLMDEEGRTLGICATPGCGKPFTNPLHGRRLYCSDACRDRYDNQRDAARAAARREQRAAG